MNSKDPVDVPERSCFHCNYGFPAQAGASEKAICLNDPAFEPYLDGLLEHQDYSGCRELVREREFPWDREAAEWSRKYRRAHPDAFPVDARELLRPERIKLSKAAQSSKTKKRAKIKLK